MGQIKIGDAFKNFMDEIHVVNKISKTGLIITAKNIGTNQNKKFRFYEASGLYIKEGTANVSLGDSYNINTLEVNKNCEIVQKNNINKRHLRLS